jgi:hypothetical protein
MAGGVKPHHYKKIPANRQGQDLFPPKIQLEINENHLKSLRLRRRLK